MSRRAFALELCLGIFLALFIAGPAGARQDKGAEAKEERVEGIVHMVDTKTMVITVTLKAKTNQREVLYTDKTAFTFRNKPSKLEEVKEGRRVICLGKTNDKNQLVATRVDVRDEQ
ncbi:MAG TPA: hypothetical protein VD833_11980 [Vicinamibacterales bacterium]|nr:hypothetical protein [Vicinamibacterales bacterium]